MLPSESVDAEASKPTVPPLALDASAASGRTFPGVSVGGAASGPSGSASCAASDIAGTASAREKATAASVRRGLLTRRTLPRSGRVPPPLPSLPSGAVGPRLAIRMLAATGGIAVLLVAAAAPAAADPEFLRTWGNIGT